MVLLAMARAALFDLDKTLVRKNTVRLYTRFQRDRGDANWRDALRVGWWLALYSLGKLDADSVARKALAKYAGELEQDLIERCGEWFPQYVLPHVADQARCTVEKHRAAGDHLVIATSGTRYGAEPLLRELAMDDLICSELEIKDRRFTGNVLPPLCYGEGKLKKAKQFLASRQLNLEDAAFYSDSITDLPLLEAVRDPVAVNPDLRLAREAARRGWQVEYW